VKNDGDVLRARLTGDAANKTDGFHCRALVHNSPPMRSETVFAGRLTRKRGYNHEGWG
jgi:hypothetical protein